MELPAASVRRLHLRTSAPARAPARLRRSLDALDLEAPGLPPSAILVVRRLEAPPWSAGRDERQWSAGLRETLGAVARRAARPMLGGRSEEAVWFADMAELLACLALDAALGRAPWWWDGLERPLRPASWRRAWLEQVEHLPRAVEHLARERLIPAALGGLAPAEAMILLGALQARWGLSGFGGGGDSNKTTIISSLNNISVTSVTRDDSLRESPAPWSAWTQATHELPPELAALVGVALGLIHAPAELRSSRFALAARRWLEEVRRPLEEERPSPIGPRSESALREPAAAREAGPTPPRTLREAHAPPLLQRAPRPSEVAQRGEAAPPAPLPPTEARVATARPGAEAAADLAPPSTREGKNGAAEENASVTSVTPSSTSAPEPPRRAPARAAAARGSAPRAWRSDPALPAALDVAPSLPLPLATQLGGAFYLVNVGILLGLYGDFTRPAEPGIDLPLFDWVARVARALWPDAPAEDPLWALLHELAWGSAEPDAPDRLPPLPDWRVRPAWPPLAADEPSDASLEIWLARLLPALEDRLTRAMPELPPARWLAQTGLVLRSSARLEVVFSLETHPIDLRIAGLDRDPGWVPSAGHTLLFRYAT